MRFTIRVTQEAFCTRSNRSMCDKREKRRPHRRNLLFSEKLKNNRPLLQPIYRLSSWYKLWPRRHFLRPSAHVLAAGWFFGISIPQPPSSSSFAAAGQASSCMTVTIRLPTKAPARQFCVTQKWTTTGRLFLAIWPAGIRKRKIDLRRF